MVSIQTSHDEVKKDKTNPWSTVCPRRVGRTCADVVTVGEELVQIWHIMETTLCALGARRSRISNGPSSFEPGSWRKSKASVI